MVLALSAGVFEEVTVGVFGVLAVWIIWRLRDRPEQSLASATGQPAQELAST